jgi:hypothetical protein
MNGGALAGLAIMVGSQAATLARLEPFYSWNTPICWTGFILFADSLVYRARGRSWIRSAPREFVLLALASIPLWLVFEFYNLYLNNWNYTGLPENWWLRMFGYGWAFATITPAIFEGAELVGLLWDPAGAMWDPASAQFKAAGADQPSATNPPEGGSHIGRGLGGSHIGRGLALSHIGSGLALSSAAGVVMLIVPFVVSAEVARYLAAPVFLGFIFLLDPINRRLGAESLNRRRFFNLLASGLLCGVLWEFWNYWAGAKWHYTVPIMERLKVFEMPLPGYFGFPPFAVECFVMYVFVRALAAGPRAGRPIAL